MTDAALLGAACPPELVARVAENLAAVRAGIVAAGGDPGAVRVVAVTKGFGLAAVRAARACGLEHVGENYADELVAKDAALAAAGETAPRWHFLGAIQQNKVGRLAGRVARFEGVDRLAEGERIARLAPGSAVCVEVDTTGQAGRGGVAPGEVGALVRALGALPLRVEGLMTVAPAGAPAERAAAFATVARLVEELGLADASMGMSDDFPLAVAAGATTLRLGRVLFGPRPPRAGAADG